MQNNIKHFIISSIWFFVTSILVYIAIQIWNNPLQIIEIKDSFSELLFLTTLMFLTPALFFAALTSLTGRSVAVMFLAMIGLHVLAFFILMSTVFTGESSLGLMIIYGIIGVTFLGSAILGFLFRKFLQKKESLIIWLFIVPIVLAVSLTTRVNAFMTPTISGCSNLNIYGQIYCYDKLAHQLNDPIWCYAIRAADNIKDGCVKSITANSATKVDPLRCEILPDNQSRLQCTVGFSAESGDVSMCEKQQSARMDTCLINVIKTNYRTNQTTDCSVLVNPDNKRMCYSYWLLHSGLPSSFNKCNQISNSQEKDLCFYSYAHGTQWQGLTPATVESLKGVCNQIKDISLRNKCLAN